MVGFRVPLILVKDIGKEADDDSLLVAKIDYPGLLFMGKGDALK